MAIRALRIQVTCLRCHVSLVNMVMSRNVYPVELELTAAPPPCLKTAHQDMETRSRDNSNLHRHTTRFLRKRDDCHRAAHELDSKCKGGARSWLVQGQICYKSRWCEPLRCSPGRYADTEATINCKSCASGFYQTEEGQRECSCREGTASGA